MNISIVNLIGGSRCIIKEDGQKVYNEIHPQLLQGKPVILDFTGITQFASPFFNFAIGQLLKDINQEILRTLLDIKNINESGSLIIKRVIENASVYENDIDYRKIFDAILEKQSKDELD